MAEKQKRYTTPAGIAVYPRLNSPDTKFNPEGVYSVTLDGFAAAFSGLLEELEILNEQAYQDAVEKAKPQDKKKIIKAPVSHEVFDDLGIPNSNVVRLKFKLNATGKNKAGEVFTRKPAGFDKFGQPWDDSKVVGGGSHIKVAFTARPYFMASTKTSGLTLQVQGYQVLDLKQGNGGSAASYGFNSEASENVEYADADGLDSTDDF